MGVMSDAAPPYDAFGGEQFFTDLVAGFYRRVPDDVILSPMYPADDLPGAERRLRLFLMQYWGGPKTYGEERGHPRLRLRHAQFPVDPLARDHWLKLMLASLDEVGADLDPQRRAELVAYLSAAADAMINTNPAL